MTDQTLRVLVVDDDYRVADLHAGIVNAIPGFTVTSTANTLIAARSALHASPVDLALVDVYLPDGSGIGFIREIDCDAMVLSAATEAAAVRAAMTAGALGYLVKPFTHATLVARLAGYGRYRRILGVPSLTGRDIDAALEALRPTATASQSAAAASPTKQLVLQSIQRADRALSAGEVATAVGVSRATAQRYLSTLAATGDIVVRLRYGSTGRPEQEFHLGK